MSSHGLAEIRPTGVRTTASSWTNSTPSAIRHEVAAFSWGSHGSPEVHPVTSHLAQLARTSMRRKVPALEEALTGHFTDHHAFLLATMLARVDAITADIAHLEAKIEEVVVPNQRQRSTGWMRSPGSAARQRT
jgi:hypothetical protein